MQLLWLLQKLQGWLVCCICIGVCGLLRADVSGLCVGRQQQPCAPWGLIGCTRSAWVNSSILCSSAGRCVASFVIAACTTTNRTGTTGDATYNCDLGATVSWARGDRIRMIVPSVATTPLQQLTNRATVRDDLNRTATGTAQVLADVPAPPNSVSAVLQFDVDTSMTTADS
jgi:hypothetical protein